MRLLHESRSPYGWNCAGPGNSRGLYSPDRSAAAAPDRLDDGLAVEPSVLDEDAARVPAGDQRARHIEAGDVGLQGLRIVLGNERRIVDAHAGPAPQRRVGVVAGQ